MTRKESSKSKAQAKEIRRTANGSKRRRNVITPSMESHYGKAAQLRATDALTYNQTNDQYQLDM